MLLWDIEENVPAPHAVHALEELLDTYVPGQQAHPLDNRLVHVTHAVKPEPVAYIP